MANLNITTGNRAAARRMLNAWHDSRDVRTMTLLQLDSYLTRAINEGLITFEGARRALEKQEAARRNNAAGHHDHDDIDPQRDEDDVCEQDGDAGFNAAEDKGEHGDGEANQAQAQPEPEWDDQLDESQDGDGDGEADSEDGDGEDNADKAADGEDGEDESEDDAQGEDEDESEDEHEDKAEAEQEQEDREQSNDDEDEDDSEDEQEDEDESEGKQEQQQEQEDEDHDEQGRKRHKMFPVIMKYIRAGLNVALVGPAGTGKSTIALQVAEELGLEFRSTGALMSKYDLVGYKDATGQYHATPLYESFTSGCLFCFDELDGSSPDAVVSFNAVTDNQGCFAFPNGMQYKHDKFVAIACLNTWGNGATADYVGRFKQDAASMSRFVRVFIDYDEAIEIDLGPADIVDRVWKLRAACTTLGIRHVVSTRMIIFAKLAREQGVTRREIDRDILFAGLDEAAITQVKAQMKTQP